MIFIYFKISFINIELYFDIIRFLFQLCYTRWFWNEEALRIQVCGFGMRKHCAYKYECVECKIKCLGMCERDRGIYH